MNVFLRPLLALAACGCATAAVADPLELPGGLVADYKLTLGYVAALRVEQASPELIDGPSRPASGPTDGGTLPTTVNNDDGNRNFRRGSLVNNRLSALAELQLGTDDYGLVASGSAFYDQAYHGRNDNDSPETVNKSGAHNRFTSATEHYGGERARLLDAYLFGQWELAEATTLDARVGQQVVAWGEALFFPGISAAQGHFDGIKSNIPGVEVKDLLLPAPSAYLRLRLPDELMLMGYYKFGFEPTELPPTGDYFSPNDGIGPGATFLYGAPNPFFSSFGAAAPGTPQNINLQRGPDILARDSGEWGVGLQYQLNISTTVGAYYLKYHQNTPGVVLNYGPLLLVAPVTNASPELQAQVSALGLPPSVLTEGITTETLGQRTPNSYQLKYFEDVTLYGGSFSTQVGPVQVAGEASYRDGAAIIVYATYPTFARARASEAKLSALYLFSTNSLWDDAVLIGEVGYTYVNDVDAVDGSTDLGDSKRGYAYQLQLTPTRHAVLAGLDVSLPISVTHLVSGAPAVAASLGSLVGEGDIRATVGITGTYLQRLQLGLSYNAYLGGDSLARHPYADRDYAAVFMKYGF